MTNLALFQFLSRLLRGESSGAIILMLAAAAGLVVANSSWAAHYTHILHHMLGPLSTEAWINDALMALFFLMVGLEIKREMLTGALASWRHRALPGIAAAGGMIVPALIFAAFTWHEPAMLRGWAIPSATDIAFALGVLTLLGPGVPASLRLFLTALAILDDLGAVLVIAVFYTADLSWPALGGAAVVLLALVVLGRCGVQRLWPYLLLGLPLWICVFLSGVHATVAGVLLALTIPHPGATHPPLLRLEHALLAPVTFLVIPLFGFANAGLSFAGIGWAQVFAPLPLGIACGLLFGKCLGVFGAAWLAVRAGLAAKPLQSSWAQLFGVALLCGIGFTMSLFIALLAFSEEPMLLAEAKLGILSGSLIAALLGCVVLKLSAAPRASHSLQ